jgi:TfoX/Sxy family transcriptional regulator of competence genes
MTLKKECNIPAEKLALYDKLIATNPEIQRKGKTVPYTSYNGNMFTFFPNNGILAIRLPEKERENFIKKYKTKLMESYGAIMKEYVEVPDSLLEQTDELKKYLEISYNYVKLLKPKSTKKNNTKKKT